MKKLAISKNTRIMTFSEFQRFMKNKIFYSQDCSYLLKGKYDKNWIYPYNFILSKKIKLKKRTFINEELSQIESNQMEYETIDGTPLWEVLRWRATLSDKNKKVYVTRYPPETKK